ncbi:SPW repeat protein [Paeniglutamicibacter antarcticus]|uniref:SPW repeat protein n=1 Tax=Arthrobacter terrae TaxID=2935737 RepID=A0A931CTJ0_9MICC|nr:SPW repeat protein [Arthrobacter terrae]MBG0740656.1 SPW repeat protein [Arthrobacter terrae]
MKKWTRWQDWAAIVVGLYAVLATMWTTHAGASVTLMIIFGGLLVIAGLVNLAMPGMQAMEWAQVVVAALLFISPWIGSYTGASGAAWTSWITGAIGVIVTAAAIKPSMAEHHHGTVPSH